MEITLRNGKKIGDSHPCYVIMDVAANHNCDLDTALKLIEEAAKSGADAVKFQTYTAEGLYSKNTPQFSRDKEKPYDLIKKVQHPRSWLPILAEHAKKCGIDFLSTPFDHEAVDLLDELDVAFYKIASAELVDLRLIEYTASKMRPIVISTGMASLGEIEEAIAAIVKTGNKDVAILQCTTKYPSPPEIINLNAMDTMKSAFKRPVGFSDHSLGWHIALAAVSKGACMIEKHFTLDSSQEGPDHSFAIEPEQLKQMVSQIRDIELAMGNGVKHVNQEEMESYVKGRRGLIAKVDIPKGTKITDEMIIIKRPGYGIKPNQLDILIGMEAKTDIGVDTILTWDMFK